MQMRFGLRFQSGDNHCQELYATIPFPREWPEQSIRVLNADLPDNSQYEERELPSGAKQLVLEVPALGAQQELDVVVTVEIEKRFIKAPEDTSSLVFPKKSLKDKEIAWSLGDSPYIETKNVQLRSIIKEIKESEPENAWKYVEGLYDWVRNNIRYKNGPIARPNRLSKTNQATAKR